jgi:8-oxo-dGTP diphosphatase
VVVRQLDVVGAVIVEAGRVLCAQRGPEGALASLWEFPGGKVEPGESPKDALAREIAEELRCVVEVGDQVTTTSHAYDFGVVVLTTFWCRLIEGTPDPTEHASIRWLEPRELGTVTWAPADVPAAARVRAQLTP